jgi:hypothetical protein
MEQIDVTTTLNVAYDASKFISERGSGYWGVDACQIAIDVLDGSLNHAIHEGMLTAGLSEAEVEVWDWRTDTRFDVDSNTVHLSTELKVSYDYVADTPQAVQSTIEAMFNHISANGGLSGSSLLTVDSWKLEDWSLSGRPSSSSKAVSLVEIADHQLTADQLREKYEALDPGDHWAEHPDFTHGDWAQEAAELNTLAGYWDWVVSEIEQRQHDIGNGLDHATNLDAPNQKTSPGL